MRIYSDFAGNNPNYPTAGEHHLILSSIPFSMSLPFVGLPSIVAAILPFRRVGLAIRRSVSGNGEDARVSS